jgi:hypothetical protein
MSEQAARWTSTVSSICSSARTRWCQNRRTPALQQSSSLSTRGRVPSLVDPHIPLAPHERTVRIGAHQQSHRRINLLLPVA